MSLKLVSRDNQITKGYSTNVYLKDDNKYINCFEVEFSATGAVRVEKNGFVVGLKKGRGKIVAKYNGVEVTKCIKVVDEKTPLYVGHRGARPLSQDEFCVPNTKCAFEIGAQRATYGIETDIRYSPDKVIYCHHDGEVTTTPMNFLEEELKKKKIATTDNVNDINYSTLKKLHIYWDNGDRRDLTKIATFVEYLKVCKKYKKKCVLEYKWTNGMNDNDQSNVDETVQIVKDLGMYENVFFMTSMRPVLAHIREKNPDAAMQLLTGYTTTTMDSVDWAIEHQASFDAYHPNITDEMIEKMHKNNLYVNAWTVNSREIADQLLARDIDMITTDLLQGEKNE